MLKWYGPQIAPTIVVGAWGVGGRVRETRTKVNRKSITSDFREKEPHATCGKKFAKSLARFLLGALLEKGEGGLSRR